MSNRILFYYPSNKRSIQIETELAELINRNVKFTFLSTCETGELHIKLNELGIETYTNNIKKKNSFVYYLKQIFFLIRFCNHHKIDIVWSNLQHANFIAVFAQYFIKSKVICFRHHFKFIKGFSKQTIQINKTEKLFDRAINSLAKKIIVPSAGVYNGMKDTENINIKKVQVLPYIYDFNRYIKPPILEINEIKLKHPAHLNLLMCARLIPFKRHNIVFPIIKKLVNEGLDIKMFVLDTGPELENLTNYINENNLKENIVMLGFRTNFMAYMAASDILVHPSLTEASNNVVKELGLMQKTVIVCSGVGDFDDYIIHGDNGFLVSSEAPEIEIERIIRKLYQDKSILESLGENLNNIILEKYNLSKAVIEQYIELTN